MKSNVWRMLQAVFRCFSLAANQAGYPAFSKTGYLVAVSGIRPDTGYKKGRISVASLVFGIGIGIRIQVIKKCEKFDSMASVAEPQLGQFGRCRFESPALAWMKNKKFLTLFSSHIPILIEGKLINTYQYIKINLFKKSQEVGVLLKMVEVNFQFEPNTAQKTRSR